MSVEYPKTHWSLACEILDDIEMYKLNKDHTDVDRLISDVEKNVLEMVKKMVATPTATSYSLFRDS